MKEPCWFDTRLSEEEMAFLNHAISEENKENVSKNLAGNISKSELIKDKDNWFYKTTLKKLTERMFYRDWDNFSKYHIEVEEGTILPEFEMDKFWVNYMKQHEFNPIHDHGGLYSFVVFLRIPTHWKEQHALPFSANSNTPCASDFEFMWSKKGSEMCENMGFRLCSEDEGRILFFPATLKHQVYPFYECEEERVTISGNIQLHDPNRQEKETKKTRLSGDVYEDKEKMLKMMEQQVFFLKEELERMKKG